MNIFTNIALAANAADTVAQAAEKEYNVGMSILYETIIQLDWRMVVMWLIGALLIYLAIKKEMEPTLLLPIGFGAIAVNLPLSGIVTRYDQNGVYLSMTQFNEIVDKARLADPFISEAEAAYNAGVTIQHGFLTELFDMGISNELFPLILFIGIGAMIDFGPLLTTPKLMIFGAAAQFGIFFTLCLASVFFPNILDAASIAIIGAADGPTAIVVAQQLGSQYTGAIMVAAYSYMALVPIIQPPIIKLLTTKKERMIRMPYEQKSVSKTTKILFPIVITIVVGLIAPASVSLIFALMFGNLIRECGVLDSLSKTASDVLANLITIFLGITIASQMQFTEFLRIDTLIILGLGLVAFVMDTAGGVLFAKLLNIFMKKKVNPMIGAAGISAFPMSGRIVHKMGLAEDPQNFLLMHSIGVNVSGQVASVIAGGLILSFFGQ